MKLNFGEQFEKLERLFSDFLKTNIPLQKGLAGCQIDVGLESDHEFAVPASAAESALFVGDSAHIGNLVGANSKLEKMFKDNPNSINMKPTWNWQTNKWDMQVTSRMVTDSNEFIPAQILLPWNVSYFQGVFKKPLSYSVGEKLVKAYSGTEPWADVMNLVLADYAGFAAFANSGRPDNMLTQDVNVQSGFMSSAVINMTVSYSLTMQEIERAKANSSPFGGMLITEKQKFADYALNILKAFLIYYGYAATGTIGLLSVNNVTAWSGVGTSLQAILADSGNTTKGSVMYQQLATQLNSFLTAADNKFNVVDITMSPNAYNILSTTVYSNIYNPETATKIIKENLQSDLTKDGRALKLNIYSDPMIKATNSNGTNPFNAQSYDYLIFSAPEVEAGASEEQQDLILFGEPLAEFVYPTIPGSYHSQYKKLKRIAGVFAPVGQAVAAYSGYGSTI